MLHRRWKSALQMTIILVESVSLNSYFYIHFILPHVCGMCIYYACVCVCMPVHVVVCVFMGKCVIMNMWGQGGSLRCWFPIPPIWERVSLLVPRCLFQLSWPAGFRVLLVCLLSHCVDLGLQIWTTVSGFMWVLGIWTHILMPAKKELFTLSYLLIIFSTFTKREEC